MSGFQREEYHHLEMRIRAMGGEIVSRSYPGIPDFGVVPFCGGIFRGSVNEIVTDMFIVSISSFFYKLIKKENY